MILQTCVGTCEEQIEIWEDVHYNNKDRAAINNNKIGALPPAATAPCQRTDLRGYGTFSCCHFDTATIFNAKSS